MVFLGPIQVFQTVVEYDMAAVQSRENASYISFVSPLNKILCSLFTDVYFFLKILGVLERLFFLKILARAHARSATTSAEKKLFFSRAPRLSARQYLKKINKRL